MYSVLNVFPILFLAPLGYFVLRVLTGMVLISLARTYAFGEGKSRMEVAWGVLASSVGTLLILGLFTQIAALAALFLVSLGGKMMRTEDTPPTTTRVLIGAIALSLLVTGAGAFALDLPL